MTSAVTRALAGMAATGVAFAGVLAPAPAAAEGDTTPPYFTAMTSGLEVGEWIESMSWWAADADSGVDHVRVRFKVKPAGGTWSRWHYPERWHYRKAHDHIHKYIRPHRAYIFEMRAFDRSGNRSTWTMVGGAARS